MTSPTRHRRATRPLAACLFAFALACGGPAIDASDPSDPSDSDDVADEESAPPETIVCRRGAEGDPSAIVQSCPEGLSCCYPCGVEGCSWVCATPERCEAWSTLPSAPPPEP